MSNSVTRIAQFVNSYRCHKHINYIKCPLANIQQQSMTQSPDYSLNLNVANSKTTKHIHFP